MDEVKWAARELALKEFEGFAGKFWEYTPAFKQIGMLMVSYSISEPELFKLLFLSENAETQITHFLPYYDARAPEILETVEKSFSADKEKAKKIYNHMSVYAFGFASLYAQRIYMFTMDYVH